MHALHVSLSPALQLVVAFALHRGWKRTERLPSPCLSRRFYPYGNNCGGMGRTMSATSGDRSCGILMGSLAS